MKGRSGIAGIVALVFVWSGMIMAISFMEAWLKFRAPGITLPLGLGIGRLVFRVLNGVEWILCFSIAIVFLATRPVRASRLYVFYGTCVALLLLQSVWLLPALDARAEQYIQHRPVSHSLAHLYYGIAEVIKCGLLLVCGIRSLRILIKQPGKEPSGAGNAPNKDSIYK